MRPMSEYRLYTRPGCHLCDEALALCADAGFRPEAVDISGDLALLRHYSDRIPVLRCVDTGDELGWPFDAGAVMAFLGRD